MLNLNSTTTASREHMKIKKQGIILECEHCRCTACHGDSFDVAVPVCDRETGTHASARLHCSISPARHQVELVAWHVAGATGSSPPGKSQPRIAAALRLVADRRLCGNRRLCPREVIRIVDKHGRGTAVRDATDRKSPSC